MQRRDFIALLGVAASWPFAAGWSTPCDVPSKFSAAWPNKISMYRRSSESNFASARLAAILLPIARDLQRIPLARGPAQNDMCSCSRYSGERGPYISSIVFRRLLLAASNAPV